MKNLISTHQTPIISQVIGWSVVGFMVLAFIAILAWTIPCVCTIPIIFFIIQLTHTAVANVGLQGWPAQHLEIYEEGLELRTFLETKKWRWSHVRSIRGDLRGDRYALELENFRGDLLKIEKLSRWRDAKNHIATLAGSAIHQRTVNAILRGDYVTVTPFLQFGRKGVIIRKYLIPWDAIQEVHVHRDYVVIRSPQINNVLRRVYFPRERTHNGIIYGKLMHELWRDAAEITQPVELVSILIDGIAFNSEGEMIQFADRQDG
jgi:hypothetical protein